MNKQEEAQIIVQLVLKDLRGRRGFKFLLEGIELDDPETYEEIINDLTNIVRKKL